MRSVILSAIGLVAVMSNSLLAQTNDLPVRQSPARPKLSLQTTNELGLVTNGPAVMRLFRITQTWTNDMSLPAPTPAQATNPLYLRMREARMRTPAPSSSYTWTNAVFESFRPNSLNHAIWTNFVAQTNGRTTQIWSERTHPGGWPTNKPSVRWNTNNLMWGMKGLTALSPCWSGEGAAGQVPLTLLTRRHAYTRGHGFAPDGFHTNHAGYKAWFLTRDNVVVEAVVKRTVSRITPTNGIARDYTIVLFDRDLPKTIDSMAVLPRADVQTKYHFTLPAGGPCPIFQTEQGGQVGAAVSPFVVNTWKPGDSGSPDMLPVPGELVFFGGRSTTGPSRQMQEDINELCRLEHLDPKKYQLRWADLSDYPDY